MGENIAPFLFTYPPLLLLGGIGDILNFAWAERIVWFFPFFLLSMFSSSYLVKTLFPENKFWFFSPLVFLLNTYILMIVGGGQMGLALAYAISPIAIAKLVKAVEKERLKIREFTILGLVLSIEVMFDPRIAYLALVILFLYLLWTFFVARIFSIPFLLHLMTSLLIALGLHAYWILPTMLSTGGNISLPQNFESSSWLEFLSFAQFSNSISLFHPLWPENIFGKVGFMRPEFLVVTIVAYSALLFINSKRKTQSAKLQLKTQNFNILFFALLGLIGAFLAKGSNPPFGEVYLWLFNNFPGMNMFRDPTKFYTLVALSYSILIPFSLTKISERVSSIKYKVLGIKILNTYFLILASFLIFWLFLIRSAWMGELGGTFKAREVPQEYVELKDFLSSQPEFFRTFWVPRKQRFGFYSNNHPAIYAQEFVSPDVCQPLLCELADESKKPLRLDPLVTPETEILDRVRDYSLSYFNNPDTHKVFAQMGVKYVIVPFDSEGEIFLRDRKYSKEEQEKYITILDKVSWLKKVTQFEKNAVYETQNYQDHFFTEGEKIPQLKWEMVNPTQYKVEVKNADQPFTLVFSETYDDLWQAKIKGEIIPSKKIYGVFNSFRLDKKGSFNLTIEFTAQKYVWWGGVISLLTLMTSIFLLLRKR